MKVGRSTFPFIVVILSLVLTSTAVGGPRRSTDKQATGHRHKPAPTRASDADLLQNSIRLLLDLYGNTYAVDRVAVALATLRSFSHKGLQAYADNGYTRLSESRDPTTSFLRFGKNNARRADPLCDSGPDASPMNCAMIVSLWCDVVPPPETFLRDVQRLVTGAKRGNNADEASHILIVLSELKSRGCLLPAHVDALLNETSRFLVRRIDAQKDAYGEGVAVLLRAGFLPQVREEWIDLIRESLQRQIDTDCRDCRGDPHELMLEVYALAQWHKRSVSP